MELNNIESKVAAIAEEMGFSYQWICKLHGKALSKIFTDLYGKLMRFW